MGSGEEEEINFFSFFSQWHYQNLVYICFKLEKCCKWWVGTKEVEDFKKKDAKKYEEKDVNSNVVWEHQHR